MLTITYLITHLLSLSYPEVDNVRFNTGEEIEYSIHYGLIKTGKINVYITDSLKYVNGRPVYEIRMQGRSTGMMDVFYPFENYWITYLDTAEILPQLVMFVILSWCF